MDEITLTILGFGRDFKVAVYKNNKIHKVNKDFEDEYSEHEPGCCR